MCVACIFDQNYRMSIVTPFPLLKLFPTIAVEKRNLDHFLQLHVQIWWKPFSHSRRKKTFPFLKGSYRHLKVEFFMPHPKLLYRLWRWMDLDGRGDNASSLPSFQCGLQNVWWKISANFSSSVNRWSSLSCLVIESVFLYPLILVIFSTIYPHVKHKLGIYQGWWAQIKGFKKRNKL